MVERDNTSKQTVRTLVTRNEQYKQKKNNVKRKKSNKATQQFRGMLASHTQGEKQANFKNACY